VWVWVWMEGLGAYESKDALPEWRTRRNAFDWTLRESRACAAVVATRAASTTVDFMVKIW
jgi:hypothetical protein